MGNFPRCVPEGSLVERVLPNGELVWNRVESGREELWLGELR